MALPQNEPLVLPIRLLSEGNNPIEALVWGAELELSRDQIALTGQVRFAGQAYRAGDRVDIRGEITARTELACDRCLEPVSYEMKAQLRVFAERKESRDRRSDEELREDDTGIIYHDGLSLDLTNEVRQLLLLELPWHILCREECQGLCPVCGCNRNQETCNCRSPQGDKRWDALRTDQT